MSDLADRFILQNKVKAPPIEHPPQDPSEALNTSTSLRNHPGSAFNTGTQQRNLPAGLLEDKLTNRQPTPQHPVAHTTSIATHTVKTCPNEQPSITSLANATDISARGLAVQLPISIAPSSTTPPRLDQHQFISLTPIPALAARNKETVSVPAHPIPVASLSQS